jgi:hypothetical protein
MQKSQCRVLNAEESASELSLDLHARVAGKPTQSRATGGGSPTTFVSARSRYSFRTVRPASYFGTPPDDPNLATCHEKKKLFPPLPGTHRSQNDDCFVPELELGGG